MLDINPLWRTPLMHRIPGISAIYQHVGGSLSFYITASSAFIVLILPTLVDTEVQHKTIKEGEQLQNMRKWSQFRNRTSFPVIHKSICSNLDGPQVSSDPLVAVSWVLLLFIFSMETHLLGCDTRGAIEMSEHVTVISAQRLYIQIRSHSDRELIQVFLTSCPRNLFIRTTFYEFVCRTS